MPSVRPILTQFAGLRSGRGMDQADRLNASMTLANVRTGVSSSWFDPGTGYECVLAPTLTYDQAPAPAANPR